MKATKFFTASILIFGLATVAQADSYRHGDQYDSGRAEDVAREIVGTAQWIHEQYERNNRRPDRDEARVAAALHDLEVSAARFYDEVGGNDRAHSDWERRDRRDNRGTRSAARELQDLFRVFDSTAESLRYISNRPYVDRGMERIGDLLAQLNRTYGFNDRHGRYYRYDRNDRNDRDRNDRDRRQWDSRRNDREYRPPQQ